MKQIARRPFESIALHDEVIARRWNETVRPNDEIWHLGDFALSSDPGEIMDLLQSLSGRKHLVIGNNDSKAAIASSGWDSVQHYVELQLGDKLCICCHYPFRTWNQMSKGALNLHGHSHGKLKGMPRQIDVGVDNWGFRPVSLDEIFVSKTKVKPEPTSG